MKMKIVEYSFPIIVISMIYLICDCRDLRHTNNLQDVALGEINNYLSLLMKSKININDHAILENESGYKFVHNEQEDIILEDLFHQHHDETTENNYESRKISHGNYDEHRYGHDVSLKYIYRNQSFNVANRMKKKKTMKEIWTKQQAFSKGRDAVRNQKHIGDNSLKKIQQKVDLRKKIKQLDRNVESRKLIDYASTSTSCILTKLEVIPPCEDDIDCGDIVRCDGILNLCQKSCDACPLPVSLLENKIIQEHEKDANAVATFNMSLYVITDDYANEISWNLLTRNSNDLVFHSNEMNATSQLLNDELHNIQYNCKISQNKEKENELNSSETTISTCYDFEVYDSIGDGMCCKYGDGSFSMKVTTDIATLQVTDEFEDGSMMSTSFCIKHDDGEIYNDENNFNKTAKAKEHSSHYPYEKWHCKNGICKCSSKPLLSADVQVNHAFLFEVTMSYDSDKLQDAESPQYRAACWVLYDDPYKYDLIKEGAHKKMMQRYILAVLYFATSPEKWDDHHYFLSSRAECDWDDIGCDKEGNIITVNIVGNNLDGMIVEELSGLRMLEVLDLDSNNIRGTIPAVLGRLSKLRVLSLIGNKLDGTLPPQLFNATNVEYLNLGGNKIEGMIPETIGNLQKLSELTLKMNNLSGSIPHGIYTLSNLKELRLSVNKLSSSISPSIGNLNQLEGLYLYDNVLTGLISSTIGSLPSLREIQLSNNRFSGTIPTSLFDLPELNMLFIEENSIIGSIPEEFCGIVQVQADCRNDVFDPKIKCSCCFKCEDETPIWNSSCADSAVKVVIDHNQFSSNGLEWSLTNDATRKEVLFDGPYFYQNGLKSYEACVAYSDCLSINQISPPAFNTNYQIYWSEKLIHNGTFQGSWGNSVNSPQTLLSFQYDEENEQLASCGGIEYICDNEEEPILLIPNTTKRTVYNEIAKISGRSTIQDISSSQSKALCWMINNYPDGNKTDISDTEVIQRYILAILHFMSPHGLFGVDGYLPEKHECEWQGVQCKDNNTKIVTDISFSSEFKQIINGTLIDEIGSLKYLEVLNLNQTYLHGTIPRSFSNLWSLVKLDLSDNKISSTMPATLYRHLGNLEFVDLSNNKLIGSINNDIGSYSHIRTLLLSENELTGSLPLDNFKHNSLEHFDTSGNKLSSIDFSLILKHENLSSLHEHTFTSLNKLQNFNISQNDFSGRIPSTFPELSNITHFDLSSNRFKGQIPIGIKELNSVQHLNLQGNKLTGSLPSELNQLQSLTTLVLSHNEFKGSIPFDQKILPNMERLHLHNNKFMGEAPQFSDMTYYISDCGFPSDSLEPVTCSSCNICCNSDGSCQDKSLQKLSQVRLTLIFMFTIIGLIIICYTFKEKITSNRYFKSFFDEKVKIWNALMLISDKSVYHFLLIDNKTEWYVAVLCGVFQAATLFLFVRSADMVNDISDREYFMLCPANSLECDDLNKVSAYGIFVFGLILTIWLLRDIIGSVKLMLVSFEKRNIDFFFTSAVVFSVTMLSLWTSILYIDAIAAKNTDMIKDAVVLLFVVEIDERIFQLVESVNPDWVQAIDNNMRNSLVYEGHDLVISTWTRKITESLKLMRDVIRERCGSFLNKRNSNNGVEKREVEDIDEDIHDGL